MAILTGGCGCGAVRYSIDAVPEFSINCHCRKCQRATGTGHATSFAVPVKDVQIEGEIREHPWASDAGSTTYSGFCPTCGSPLSSRTERFPERLFLMAGSLDHPAAFAPDFVVYADEAQPWDVPITIEKPE